MRLLLSSCFLFLCLAFGCTNASTPNQEQVTEIPMLATAVEKQPDQSDTLPGLEQVLNLDYLRGQFTPSTHPLFERVDDRYTDGDGSYYLHQATYLAFRDMHAAAAADSINLVIVSATRNFDRQKLIWEAKWRGERLLEGREKADEAYPDPAQRALAILRYSSMPGTSRHHWGSDIDLNRLTNEYFESGTGKAVYDWLQTNATQYGFCQPYTAGRPHGYLEERWHWSFLPLAQALSDFAREHATDDMIEGFEGAESASEISVVDHYVLGINEHCL